MTTAATQTSNARPGRVFLANLFGGPLVAGALMTAPIWAVVAIGSMGDKASSWKINLALVGFWLFTALLMALTYLTVGLVSAVYAWWSTRRNGGYSVPVAIGVAASTAFVLTLSAALSTTAAHRPSIVVAMVGAAISSAAAGWLARRSGAAWSLS